MWARSRSAPLLGASASSVSRRTHSRRVADLCAEVWIGSVALGDDPVRGRPLDPEGGIVPANAGGVKRSVGPRHLVAERGVVLERLKAVRDALGRIEHPVVVGAKCDCEPLTVRR